MLLELGGEKKTWNILILLFVNIAYRLASNLHYLSLFLALPAASEVKTFSTLMNFIMMKIKHSFSKGFKFVEVEADTMDININKEESLLMACNGLEWMK